MSPGSLETARPSVTGATQGSCESDHGHSCGERLKGKVFLWSSPTWRAIFRRSLAELRRSSKSSSELAVHAVVSLERLLMARRGSTANVRSCGNTGHCKCVSALAAVKQRAMERDDDSDASQQRRKKASNVLSNLPGKRARLPLLCQQEIRSRKVAGLLNVELCCQPAIKQH
jgi:hypothetical protein